MRVAIVYVFPQLAEHVYEPMARRFADKFIEYPPGIADHIPYIVANGGGKITPRQERLFHPLVPQFLYHDNAGKDVGAYMNAARTLTCDLLMCIGSPVRPCHAVWLDIIVAAVEDNGPGLYGPWGSHTPTPHLSTTAFAIAPEILKAYPYPVRNETRYQFEHGTNSITAFTLKSGFAVRQVTARGVFGVDQFHVPSRSESLFLGQVTNHYGYRD